MQPQFSVGCNALMGTNKTGHLPKNSDGSWRVVLGALNFFNSRGEIYTQASGEAILREGTGFRRRLDNSQCKGEYGHPKLEPGMTDMQYIQRICRIEETRVCHLHKEVWLDTLQHQGQAVLSFMGDIETCGPYGDTLEQQLENPNDNVAFSIRSITDDRVIRGINNKSIIELAAWDYVTEPGLSIATKYNNPALESMNPDIIIDINELRAVADTRNNTGISNEAADMIKGILLKMDTSIKSYGGTVAPSKRW